MIATTGAQGEPMAGLARMANRDHRFVEIQPGDTVIVSASPIPGNEEYVSRTIDNLFKAGANVFYHTIKRAHVSGHASQEELKLMLGLTKPKYFIPIHGEFRMQVQHGRLAIETGVAARERLHHRERHADRDRRRRRRPGAAAPVTAGYVFVDGLSVGEVGEIVLRDRKSLANDGMFMVVVTVDKQTGNVVGRPEIITRGFVHLNEQDPMMDEAIERILDLDREPGRPHQRDRPAEEPDQGRRLALPVRADEAPADGLPGRGRGLMATRRRTPTRRADAAPPAARSGAAGSRSPVVGPEVARSIVGIVLLVLGAVTLIALDPARPGRADRLVARTRSRRGSGRGRWLLPFLLLGAGWYVEWGPGKRPGSGWGATLVGLGVAYVGLLGAVEILDLAVRAGAAAGGSAGSSPTPLEPLLTRPGAFVVLAGARGRRAACSPSTCACASS